MKTYIKSCRHVIAILILGVATVGGLPVSVSAYDMESASAVNVDEVNVAIRGYDPVAYFTDSRAAKGDKQYSAAFQGATYYFVSTKNRAMFSTNPYRYAPQFGGFCAMGVALGKKLDGDPEAWNVVNGKLYLNVNRIVLTQWNKDVTEYLRKAKAKWPTIKNKVPNTL